MSRSRAARSRCLSALLPLLAAACAAAPTTMPNDVQLVHDVYFQLQDASPAAKATLVAECYQKLAAIPGVVRLAAGTRDPELARDVNDRDYDVSLHVWFRDRAAHDAYQIAPAHLAFIEANKASWSRVRVFDSTIAPR